jgi:hypothetical protein
MGEFRSTHSFRALCVQSAAYIASQNQELKSFHAWPKDTLKLMINGAIHPLNHD